MDQRCGTCGFWDRRDHGGGLGHCEWVSNDPIPEWACVEPIERHGDYTRATDGRRCSAWRAIGSTYAA